MRFEKQLIRAAVCGAMLVSGVAVAQDELKPQLIIKWSKAANDAKVLGSVDSTATAAGALYNIRSTYAVGMRSLRTMATGGEVFRVGRDMTDAELDALVADLKASAAVESVEIDTLLYPQFTPNDPMYNQQWHYFEAAGGLNLPTAWDLSTGAGVRVGVIDTGFRPHVDLAANLVGGYDFITDPLQSNDGGGRDANAIDPGDFSRAGQCGPGSRASNSSWHGTHVGGTVGAVTNNGVGVAGVAFGARVVPIRALGRCGGRLSDIADAIIWGSGGAVSGVPANANPARVLNLSLGGGGACSASMQAAINSARSRNTVVVVAAGNSNINASNATPANCAGVVTVAAVGRTGGKASYSNFGAIVDVAAPGGDFRGSSANGVLSTLNTGTTTPGQDTYAFYQGTSMATPHVAGTAALMLSRNAALTPTLIEQRLRSTARAFPATCSQCGTGIVNARAAVVSATQ
jgi:serine protease